MGAWASNGMGPLRLDRAEARLRIGEDAEPWVATELLDLFEAAAVASMDLAHKRRRKARDPEANPKPEET